MEPGEVETGATPHPRHRPAAAFTAVLASLGVSAACTPLLCF